MLVPAGVFGAVGVDITVTGVEGGLYENVLAHLSIYRHRESARLTTADVRRLHKKAKGEIASALAPFGYYQPQVVGRMERDGDTFTVLYEVDKGEPVRVRKVDIVVEGDDEAKDLLFAVREQFPLQSGDILNQSIYERGKKSIIRTAFNNGYLEAAYRDQELRIDRKNKEADIVLNLRMGAQFVFGETIFEESGVQSELLREYIPYKKGDPYKTSELIEFQKILYRTEYFSKVIVEGRVQDRRELVVPVRVYFSTPEKLNLYSIGLGYATDTGPRARFEWRNKLLNEKGHTLLGTVQVSETDSMLGFDYKVPWGNPNNDKIAFSSSYTDQIWDDTETRLISLGIGLEHNTRFMSHGGSLEYRDEDYSVGLTEGHVRLVVPGFTTNMIMADNLHITKYGIQISTSVSGAVEGAGSDVTFVKGIIGGKVILSPFDGWRFIGRGSIGATVVDSIDDLPPSLRFYAGGDQSVRGYGYKAIGPEDESGAVVGGRYLAVGSIEAEKEWKQDWSIAAFWDVGNATDDLSLDFKQGAGVGVRYRLPFGQVRLDMACAFLEDDLPVRLHLTAGADL
ncbi:autotransporter assembly complex family protein [Desulfopila sp. IMCC35008]|uniref:autotransporter assembly complex protein TamA n=1 Tax=Desulfopila sp. IMCC35008 TaxID=2653858 RepID=UPI0013D72F59|nr:autotransporter assembly complex family protein [Desulfopila sp. IMCC35008]